ncbi:hypothetical protein L6452_22684 [Arctium lappa]|uniref:Uncharacterized protein n=1 Tax=Arctium lappa TaxID=4217 RepID=A0ACB9B272_ARCLA|nr:hypothetical protein L6452_22684 [Arctium lappa]
MSVLLKSPSMTTDNQLPEETWTWISGDLICDLGDAKSNPDKGAIKSVKNTRASRDLKRHGQNLKNREKAAEKAINGETEEAEDVFTGKMKKAVRKNQGT